MTAQTASLNEDPELTAGRTNDKIGTTLQFESEHMRIWHLRLLPGERLPYHRHDRPYFWSVVTDGKGRSRFGDGTVLDIEYKRGETKYFNDLSPTNTFVHDLQNTGDDVLMFVTVEFTPR